MKLTENDITVRDDYCQAVALASEEDMQSSQPILANAIEEYWEFHIQLHCDSGKYFHIMDHGDNDIAFYVAYFEETDLWRYFYYIEKDHEIIKYDWSDHISMKEKILITDMICRMLWKDLEKAVFFDKKDGSKRLQQSWFLFNLGADYKTDILAWFDRHYSRGIEEIICPEANMW